MVVTPSATGAPTGLTHMLTDIASSDSGELSLDLTSVPPGGGDSMILEGHH